MTGDTPKTEETAPQKEALRDDERRIEETRCPYCGGTCVLNAAHTKAICQYCGHTFDITKKNNADKKAWEGVEAIKSARKMMFDHEGDHIVYDPRLDGYAAKAKERVPDMADAMFLDAAVTLLKTKKITRTVKTDLSAARKKGNAEYFTEEDYMAVLKEVAENVEDDNRVMIYSIGGFGLLWGLICIALGIFVGGIGGAVLIGFGVFWMIVMAAVVKMSLSKVPKYEPGD